MFSHDEVVGQPIVPAFKVLPDDWRDPLSVLTNPGQVFGVLLSSSSGLTEPVDVKEVVPEIAGMPIVKVKHLSRRKREEVMRTAGMA